MTPCQEIQSAAGGLASLGESDPQRMRAYAHALGCSGCRAALNEGERLMVLIDRELALSQAPVGSEVLARVSQGVLTSFDAAEFASGSHAGGAATAPRAGRPQARGFRRLFDPQVVIPAVMAGLWLAKMLPRHQPAANPAERVSTALAGLLAVAVTAAAMTLGGAFLALPAGASVLMSFVGGGAAGIQLSVGVRCAAFELMFALIPLAVAAVYAHRGRLSRPSMVLGVAAGGGSLIAQAILHVACHAQASTAHSLLFHTGPMLAAASIGAVVGTRFRRRPA